MRPKRLALLPPRSVLLVGTIALVMAGPLLALSQVRETDSRFVAAQGSDETDSASPETAYHALNGTPALDAAGSEGCPDVDQRGVDRPQGDGCDIGAVGIPASGLGDECPCSLWDDFTEPKLIEDPDRTAVELGVRFRSDRDGRATGVRFYKGPANNGPHTGSLWSEAGEQLATGTFTDTTEPGWHELTFAQPVPITAGTTYVASYHAPEGRYSVDEGYFTDGAHLNGPLEALANDDGRNGVYRYGPSGFPTETYRASNYWVDVRFVPTAGRCDVGSADGAGSLWDDSDEPQVMEHSDRRAVELGVRFRSDQDGQVTGVRFYKAPANTGPHTGSLWSETGQQLATGTFTDTTEPGWHELTFAQPVPITAGTTYTASYHAPEGRYSVDEGYFTDRAHLNGSLEALANDDGGNGVYRYGPSGFPSKTYRAHNYWVDVRFVPDADSLTPALTPTECEPTATDLTDSPKVGSAVEFPIGVWLQNPAQDADAFAALGVNTYVGLWNWPYDDQAYPGWARDALDAAAGHDATVYAAESRGAVELATQLPNYDKLSGFLGGDEPDMSDVSVGEWTANIEAMKAVSDKPVYGNFGKGLGGFDWWADKLNDAERAAYCEPLDIASVDYYGSTDPWEPDRSKGSWVYGRAVDRLEAACGDKPVFGFVELTQPWSNSPNAATPRSIRESAWNAVIHGADGLTFFLHDFWCEDGCDSILSARWADNRKAWADLNAELHAYGAALVAPDVTGPGAATSTGIPLALLTKRVDGTTFVFAQADGDRENPEGYSGEATVTVGGNVFTDAWDPYQVRVYVVDM